MALSSDKPNPSAVSLRPERIARAEALAAQSGVATFKARLEETVFLGATIEHHFRLGDGGALTMREGRSGAADPLEAGAEVALAFRNQDAVVLADTLVPALLLALVFFLIPVFIMFYQGLFDPEFTTAHFDRFFNRGAYLRIFFNSVKISVVTGLLCVLIGYPTAYFIVRQKPGLRPILLFLVLVPMWMSVLVRTYAWMVLLGREGLINAGLIWIGILDEPVRMMYTTGAVYLAMVQILLPVAVITCYGTMADIDQSLLRAARVMGARPWAAFRQVFLPLSLEGAVTGFLIVFVLSMGFFIVPALVGGPKDTMVANIIATHVAKANWGFAASVALILLVFTTIAMALVRGVSARLIYFAREKR